MTRLSPTAQLSLAALIGLSILHLMMLIALFSKAAVAPPDFVGPLNAAVLAIFMVTLWLVWNTHPAYKFWLALSALSALPGVGPHKLLIEADALVISPVVISGTLFVILLLRDLFAGCAQPEPEMESAGE